MGQGGIPCPIFLYLILGIKMPIYENVKTISYYPNPELKARALFAGMTFSSILDVGAGHGGVFDLDFWEKNPSVTRKEACDIYWIRPMPFGWVTKIGVDVTELDKHYGENEFDFVQCMETLEHVPNSRKALEQLKRVAKKAVFITSADEEHHKGSEQEEIEKINKYQKYVVQPKVNDLLELGYQVRVEESQKRQLIAWLIKDSNLNG
jgi:SAM-dependent methyltransferase